MFTRFFLAFSFAFLLSFLGNTQNTQVQISPDYELPNGKTLQGHLFSDATGHYIYFTKQAFMGRDNTIFLEKYDNNLTRVMNEEYKTASKKVNMHGIRYFKDKFIWLMSKKDTKKGKMTYQISKIGLNGSLTKAKTISSFEYNKFMGEPTVEWAISQDTSKAFFVSLPDTDKKSKDYKAHLTVIDQNVDKMWSKTISLPYTERQVSPVSWALSNNGEVYMLAKVYDENNNREAKWGNGGSDPSYSFFLFIQKNGDSKLEKKKLDLENSFVAGAGIRVDKDGNLACTGLYKERYRGPIHGVFYLKFDGLSGEAVFSDMRDFTAKELDSFGRYNTSKDRRTKDVGLDDNFRFNDIEFLQDGGLVAIAEEYEVIVRQYNNGRGNVSTSVTYVCNSIVDIRVNIAGEVTGVNVIPKRMVSSTNMFAFYSLLNDGENLYYFYNDNRKNVEQNITDPDDMRSPSNMKSYVAVVSYIDKRGNFNRDELFKSKEVGSLMMPRYGHQIDKNRLFFFNAKTRFMTSSKFQFGVITVE